MAAHTRSGPQDLHAGVVVGQVDRLPDIHPKFLGQAGEFVGDGDVDIAVGVFHQFDHLSRGGVGQQDFTFDEGGV